MSVRLFSNSISLIKKNGKRQFRVAICYVLFVLFYSGTFMLKIKLKRSKLKTCSN